MKILSRYLLKTIASSTLIVLFIILGMDFFIQLMNELKNVGDGNYTLWRAMAYILMTMPNDLYLMFPMAGLLGALMGLGNLATHSELVVMRSSGMTMIQISRTILGCVLLFVLVVTLFYETLAPSLTHEAEVMRGLARSRGQAVATQYGIWMREGNSFFHFDEVRRSGEVYGLTRYQFDDQYQLTRVSQAQSGQHQGQGWQVKQVQITELSPQKIMPRQVSEEWWPLHLDPSILRIAATDPSEMSLFRLQKVIRYQKANALRSADYALVFWQRVFSPLIACVMMLLAIPFIFGPLRTATMGLRLVAGVIFGFSFYILNQIIGPFSLVYQIPAILAAGLPLLLFAGVGFVLMRRVR